MPTAILKIPMTNDDGSAYDLLLGFEGLQRDDGTYWGWHLPNNFGYANAAGRFFKDNGNNTTLNCTDEEGNDLKLTVAGCPVKDWAVFPFAPEDLSANVSGTLTCVVANSWMQAGQTYAWNLYDARA
jgi:hypothetical protein